IVEVSGGRRPIGSKLWNSATQQTEPFDLAEAGPVGFRPDGTPFQFVARDGEGKRPDELMLMNLANKTVIHRFKIPGKLDIRSMPEEVGMLPDGSLVGAPVKLPDGRTATAIWDGVTGKQLHTFMVRASCVVFSPDRALAALGDDAGRIFVHS